jgi:hypothetical protein
VVETDSDADEHSNRPYESRTRGIEDQDRRSSASIALKVEYRIHLLSRVHRRTEPGGGRRDCSRRWLGAVFRFTVRTVSEIYGPEARRSV